MRIPIHSFNPEKGDALARAFFDKNTTPQKRALAARALNQYAKRYGDLLTGRRSLDKTELSSASRFPSNDPASPSVLFTTADRLMVDVSWTTLFNVQDFRGTTEDGFDIADVYNPVTFEVTPSGAPIKLNGISGSETNYKFQDVTGGFQYERNWLMDNKFWRIADGMAEMQSAYAEKQSELAWTTATASGLTAETRSATAGASQLQLDIETINNAAVNILSDIYNTTDGDGNLTREKIGSARFILGYNLLTAGYVERIQRIMGASLGAANDVSGGKQLAFPVTPVGSVDIPTGVFYLFLPGRKLVAGIRQDLEVWEDYDPYKRVHAHPAYGRYRMVRGDANQGRTIPLS